MAVGELINNGKEECIGTATELSIEFDDIAETKLKEVYKECRLGQTRLINLAVD